jgi:hypothetical protein
MRSAGSGPVLEVAAIFAFLGRQLGRVASLAFSWATTALFGRVPQRKQILLSGMAIGALLWPVVLAGVLVPSVATFLLAFVTLPAFVESWVRPVMLLLALALPLGVGALGAWLHDVRPRGRELGVALLRGYPTSIGLFLVLVWMLVLAPVRNLQAILRRWSSAHVAIAVKPNGYDRVVTDVAAALGRAGLPVRSRRAGWAFEMPGRLLAVLAGRRVRRFVPPVLVALVRPDLEIVVHPMDLSMRGAERTIFRARAAITRELAFTDAYQTWSEEAQLLEDRLARAARGEDDLDEIGRRIEALAIDHEQWDVLYRLFLQVRLRISPDETDALVPEVETAPPVGKRLAGIRRAFRALWPPRRQKRAA